MAVSTSMEKNEIYTDFHQPDVKCSTCLKYLSLTTYRTDEKFHPTPLQAKKQNPPLSEHKPTQKVIVPRRSSSSKS